MKKLLYIILISTVFFMASCKCKVTTPALPQRSPDVIAKPTETLVKNETIVELPRETEVKTEQPIVATLVKETQVTTSIDPVPLILPANTEINLPKDVYLHTLVPAQVKLDPLTDVILPQGTEISISKVNWYAILFYCLLFGVASVWFIKSRQNDKNNDGFEDVKEEAKLGRKRRTKSLTNVKSVN